MSTCISRHGEYSSHEPDQDCICTLCGAVDYDALIAERDAAVARAEAAEAAVERVRNEVGLAEYRAENHIRRTWGSPRPFPSVSVDNLRRALDGGEAT